MKAEVGDRVRVWPTNEIGTVISVERRHQPAKTWNKRLGEHVPGTRVVACYVTKMADGRIRRLGSSQFSESL